MTPIRRRDLLVVALGAAVVAWLFVRTDYGVLPPLRWWLPLPVGVLAVAEALGARTLQVRLRDQRQPPGSATPGAVLRPVEPMLVTRVAVLAQASAWTAAAVTGLWVGVLVHTGPEVGTLQAASGDTRTAVLGAVLAAGLVAAALWLEHVCRIPPDGDGPPRARG